ncbi:MAG: DUF2079 domain-containing protein [Myxococcota bacterium]
MSPGAPNQEAQKGPVGTFGRALSDLPSWGLLTFAIGWLPGVSAWQYLRGQPMLMGSPKLQTTLDQGQRLEALVWGGYSLAAALLFYLVSLAVARRRDPGLTAATHFRALNGKLLILVAAPLLTVLFQSHLEDSGEFINLFLIVLTVGVFSVWTYLRLGARSGVDALPSRDPWSSPVSSAVPWLIVVAMMVVYSVWLSYLSVLEHEGLRTANWDLGIYDNIMWNTANGNFLGCSFCRAGKHYSAHFDPILWVFTPIYRLNPRAETLLILQSCWLALGGIPLFLYARQKLDHAWWACVIVAAYYMAPALQGVNLYDFHSLALLIPTAIFAVYFLDAERFVGYAISIAVLLLTREDLALLCFFIAIYAWFTGHKRVALLTTLMALLYFALVRFFVMGELGLIMESTTETRSYAWYYKELIPVPEEGALGLIVTALTDPVLTLMVLLKQEKVLYFLTLLLPVLFLPLFSGKKRILLLYGFIFIGLATRKYVYSPYFQYSSLLVPFLSLSVADAVVSVRGSAMVQAVGLSPPRLQKTLLLGVLCASVLMSSEYGVLVENRAVRGGFERLRWFQTDSERERLEELRMLIARIPPDASVAADRATGPHLSNRAQLVQWPKLKRAEYVILRDKSRKYRESMRYKDILRRHIYVVEYESPGYVLLRRQSNAKRAQKRLKDAHQKAKDKGDESGDSD